MMTARERLKVELEHAREDIAGLVNDMARYRDWLEKAERRAEEARLEVEDIERALAIIP